jgi:hypothetical protein
MGLLSKAITAKPPVTRPKQDSVVQAPPAVFSDPSAGTGLILKAIKRYWLQNPSYQGIVLSLPQYAGEAGFEKFFVKVTSMVASFGYTNRLPSKGILILFSKTRDRELLTHRLVKTLRTKALVSFEAESPDEALSRIQSCL